MMDSPRAVWIDPDGNEWELTAAVKGWRTLKNVAGLGAVPISITTDVHPRFGARVRHIHAEPRMITWPLRITGSTHAQFLQRWRDLVHAFTMTDELTPGTLRIQRPDGSARQIAAYYESGMEGEPGEGWRWATDTITLLCEDPFFSDVEPVTEGREFSNTSVDYLNPFPSVSNSQLLGTTTIVNAGDVVAYPVWTITGPADLLVATNDTTGESFTLDPNWDGGGPLTAGQTATVTTDPPTVAGPAGEIWTGALNWPGAVLWGLRRGVNDITFAIGGADPGTRIDFSYVPRYRTA